MITKTDGMRDLDISQLRAFLAVVDLRGFTAAGEALGASQSAISMRVARLEGVIGARLLLRTPRSVALTAQGHAFLLHARRIVAANDDALQVLAGVPEGARVRIALSDHAVGAGLHEALADLRDRWPGYVFEAEVGLTEEIRDAFDSGTADAVILRRETSRRDGVKLFRQHLSWFGASLAAQELRPLPLVALRGPCGVKAIMIEALNAAGVPWRMAFQGNSVEALLGAVRSGSGVTALAEDRRPKDLADLDLPKLPVGDIVLHARLPAELRRSVAEAFTPNRGEVLRSADERRSGPPPQTKRAFERNGAGVGHGRLSRRSSTVII